MNFVQVVNSQLTLQNMGGCFIILAAGICLAVLISILKIFSKNMQGFNKKYWRNNKHVALPCGPATCYTYVVCSIWIFGSERSSRSHNLRSFVRLSDESCLELSIFICLRSLKSLNLLRHTVGAWNTSSCWETGSECPGW